MLTYHFRRSRDRATAGWAPHDRRATRVPDHHAATGRPPHASDEQRRTFALEGGDGQPAFKAKDKRERNHRRPSRNSLGRRLTRAWSDLHSYPSSCVGCHCMAYQARQERTWSCFRPGVVIGFWNEVPYARVCQQLRGCRAGWICAVRRPTSSGWVNGFKRLSAGSPLTRIP